MMLLRPDEDHRAPPHNVSARLTRDTSGTSLLAPDGVSICKQVLQPANGGKSSTIAALGSKGESKLHIDSQLPINPASKGCP